MKFFLVMTILITSSSFAFANDDEPPTGSAGLLCHMSRHGETSTETLSVDYDQKLVNGTPATFNASMITWTVRRGSENEHHELNRLTGTYNYWTEGKNAAEPMPTFVCVKVPLKF
jgi:hypothetical protein